MKKFYVHNHSEELVAEGVVFSTGKVVLEWLAEGLSLMVFDDFAKLSEEAMPLAKAFNIRWV